MSETVRITHDFIVYELYWDHVNCFLRIRKVRFARIIVGFLEWLPLQYFHNIYPCFVAFITCFARIQAYDAVGTIVYGLQLSILSQI